MGAKRFVVDLDRCFYCFACEVACKQENGLPEGQSWIRVVRRGPEPVGERLFADFVPTLCRQCGAPLCVFVCPTDAIEKRADGLVLVKEEDCNGCGLCADACPAGAIQMDPERELAGKCHFCFERVDSALPPSCVAHCPGGALYFVEEEELEAMAAGKRKKEFASLVYLCSKEPPLPI